MFLKHYNGLTSSKLQSCSLQSSSITLVSASVRLDARTLLFWPRLQARVKPLADIARTVDSLVRKEEWIIIHHYSVWAKQSLTQRSAHSKTLHSSKLKQYTAVILDSVSWMAHLQALETQMDRHATENSIWTVCICGMLRSQQAQKLLFVFKESAKKRKDEALQLWWMRGMVLPLPTEATSQRLGTAHSHLSQSWKAMQGEQHSWRRSPF